MSPARVLVVDDNTAFAENLIEILSDTGYRAQHVGTAAEALRVAAAQPFEVALVDLRLPDGDGTALAAQLREKVPEGEVVLLTGFATVESAAAAVRAGACAYLIKPCATPELLLTVETALRQVNLKRDKRELARRAQTAEKLAAVGTLTAGLSHEIRNPLNAANLQLNVLERRIAKLPDPDRAALNEPLLLVKDEIRRLDHILEDFLQFARPREFKPKAVDVQPLVGRCLDLLSGDAEQRGIELLRDFQPVPPVAGDADRLRQVVMNLMLNALDATPRGGKVRAVIRAERELVAVAIEDSGPGVARELRDRIFEPFFTTKASGSGLGLPIVHAIVTQHGGTLTVEDAAGGGARFVMHLRLATAAQSG